MSFWASLIFLHSSQTFSYIQNMLSFYHLKMHRFYSYSSLPLAFLFYLTFILAFLIFSNCHLLHPHLLNRRLHHLLHHHLLLPLHHNLLHIHLHHLPLLISQSLLQFKAMMAILILKDVQEDSYWALKEDSYFILALNYHSFSKLGIM